MVYRGRVKKGVIVLDHAAKLKEGTQVSIRPVKPRTPAKPRKAKATKRSAVSPGLLRLAGAAKDLPADAARNLDHYMYGHPKK